MPNDTYVYRPVREEIAPSAGEIPQCRECGRPSPGGDPCKACRDIARVMAMSDEEVIASATPEEMGWARGMKEGIVLGRKMAVIRAVTDAMIRAATESRARDDEGEFDSLGDLLDFSGENKTRTVVRAALEAALAASEGTKRERDLRAIADVIAYWIKWVGRQREAEGLSLSADTSIMLPGEGAPPVWPTVGQLTKWLEVLRDSGSQPKAENRSEAEG